MTPTSRHLLLAALLAGCADPSGPDAERALRPPQADAALVERGTGVLVIQDLVFEECVGEYVRFDAAVPFRYHLAVTPSGRTVYLEPFVPNSGSGTAVGQTTGTVWTLARVVSPLVLRAWGDGTVIHFTARQLWVSDTGPDMHLFSRMHLVLDGEGGVVAEKTVLNRCVP